MKILKTNVRNTLKNYIKKIMQFTMCAHYEYNLELVNTMHPLNVFNHIDV